MSFRKIVKRKSKIDNTEKSFQSVEDKSCNDKTDGLVVKDSKAVSAENIYKKPKKESKVKTKVSGFFVKFSNWFNIISIAIFIFLTLSNLKKTETGSAMYYATLVFVGVYLIAFLVSVVLSFISHKNAKEAVHGAKVVASTINTTRKLLIKITLLLNLIVAGLFTLQSRDGSMLEQIASTFALGFAIMLTVFSILRKTKKLGKTVKKEARRKRKKTLAESSGRSTKVIKEKAIVKEPLAEGEASSKVEKKGLSAKISSIKSKILKKK